MLTQFCHSKLLLAIFATSYFSQCLQNQKLFKMHKLFHSRKTCYFEEKKKRKHLARSCIAQRNSQGSRRAHRPCSESPLSFLTAQHRPESAVLWPVTSDWPLIETSFNPSKTLPAVTLALSSHRILANSWDLCVSTMNCRDRANSY